MIEGDLLCGFLLESVEELYDIGPVFGKLVRRSVATDNKVSRHRVVLNLGLGSDFRLTTGLKATHSAGVAGRGTANLALLIFSGAVFVFAGAFEVQSPCALFSLACRGLARLLNLRW